MLSRRLSAAAPPVLAALVLSFAHTAAAQTVGPWSVSIARERAAATQSQVATDWLTDRVEVCWLRTEDGGWFAGVERHQRGGEVEVTSYTRGFLRRGNWAFVGGLGATPRASFQYRTSIEGELARLLAGGLVTSGGYRYLGFRAVDIHQIQPALSWYHARGDLQARAFFSRNQVTSRTSGALLVRTIYAVASRAHVGGGMAYGDRIFDAASLPFGSAEAALGFAHVRLGVTRRDELDLGVTVAHEKPSFDYRSISIGYRRTF